MDLFSTDVLLAIVDDLRVASRPRQFLLQLFFPTLVEETSEEIHFDVQIGKRRIAPFVSPLAEGKLVESQGFRTDTFKPAYIKDKRVFDSDRPLKRVIGEALTGNLSPDQRLQSLLSQDLQDQIQMVLRRKEVMAAEALRTGKITVTGDGFPTIVVDFLRDATMTKTLTGANTWGSTGISPVNDVEDWGLEMLQLSGAQPMDVIFDVEAWRLFKADQNFKDAVDIRRATDGPVEIGPRAEVGGVFRGTLGNIRLWTFQDWYVNDAGNEVPIMPAKTVIMGSAAIEGIQHHGAIRDEESGFQAREFWPKSWVQPDPSVRYLLLQSAPLIVPRRPNASLAATVA